jgi:DNA-directed RNA polymerase specialized sigma24 family protein
MRGKYKGKRQERARQLWNEHYGELAARCANELRDEAVAHQIVQEAFTRLLARLVPPRDPQRYLSDVVAALTVRRSRRAPHGWA